MGSREEKTYSLLRDLSSAKVLELELLSQTVHQAKEQGLVTEESSRLLDRQLRESSDWCALQGKDGKYLAWEAEQSLRRKCQELKMHLVAASLGVLPESYDFLLNQREESAPTSLGSIVHREGQIITARIGTEWIVLLPHLSKEDNEFTVREVQKGLLSLFQDTKLREGWIVDCSAVDQIPLMVFGSLLGFRSTLLEWNGKLRLSWLKNSAFPVSDRSSAQKFFNLKRVGDFWFSKDVGPAATE